ncbi:MAG TPA: efflux RND transporter periplasmic adaptor subunit [Steroidobacteraceae bacterium]
MIRRERRGETRTALLIAIACVALCFSACGRSGAGAHAEKGAAAPPSPFATIANGKVDIEGGVIEVAARRFGVIKDVLVHEGDVVHKGQILARQEDQDSILAINSARATVAQSQSQLALTEVNIRTAQREYERLTRLASSNSIAIQQLDQARDAVATAQAQLGIQQAMIQTARAQLAQAEYNEELTNIRAPMDGKVIRRYANPGAGASTLNVSNMFDLEPALPHIIRAEIVESAIPDVHVGQEVQIIPEIDSSKIWPGHVIRIAATFGARKLKSDSATEASDERVVEVVISADDTPFLIGQRVMVKFMKPVKT